MTTPSVYYSNIPGFSLEKQGITVKKIFRNASVAKLYERCIKYDRNAQLTSTGALNCRSGKKTGRSPQDKRIVDESTSTHDIWWGPVNIKQDEQTYFVEKSRAIDYLNTMQELYVFDGFAGADPKYRIKVRVICYSAYHAIFMHNMLIRPTPKEIETFGEPDFTVYNAGRFPAFKKKPTDSSTCVVLNFKSRELIILGSEYAGEMKKGIFTVMHYLMPKRGVLSLHSSCNESKDGKSTLFFGLSGTGKTTLSADPNRLLIGDDEHVWTDSGVFNIEGGCYAKCAHLDPEKEPEIFNAIKFGTVLENCVLEPNTRIVNYDDTSITENTRASYPIEYISNAKLSGMTEGHPNNVIMLTFDAFGVLPPVAKLTPAQAMYHFIQGYTSKVAGTEVGIKGAEATFSSCFGAPFLVFHPTKYAKMLAEKLEKHKSTAWLVNTGWSGGPYGSKEGSRIKLKCTRAIIDAIHDGSLAKAETVQTCFGLHVPTTCKGVPSEILIPENLWKDKNEYAQSLKTLERLFAENFEQYRSEASKEVLAAGPVLPEGTKFEQKQIRKFSQ